MTHPSENLKINYNKIGKCPNIQMCLAFHPSTNVNSHSTKNQITKIIQGPTCDDATSPKVESHLMTSQF
jgi:hypothetical protein